MASAKLFAVLILCLAAGNAMAQSPADTAKLIAGCGVPGSLAFKNNGLARHNAVATAKTCPAPCVKLLAAVPKTPACKSALAAITPPAVNAKILKVRLVRIARSASRSRARSC